LLIHYWTSLPVENVPKLHILALGLRLSPLSITFKILVHGAITPVFLEVFKYKLNMENMCISYSNPNILKTFVLFHCGAYTAYY